MHTSRAHTKFVATGKSGTLNVRAALMAALQREEITRRIKQAREEAGLSQPEMADALNVHWRTIQNYETVRVPFSLLNQIGEITGKTPEWLLHGDTPDLMGSLNGDASALADQIISELKAVLAPFEERLTSIEEGLTKVRDGQVEAVRAARQRLAQDRKPAGRAARAKKTSGS